MRIKLTMLLAAIAALLVPAAASAHVTVSPVEAPADGYAMLEFSVPHGCDGAATSKLTIQMPRHVISATPEEVPGWEIETKEGKLPEPAEQHGEKVTEGVREVSWTGGPLPDGHLQRFGLSVAFGGEPGEEVSFKAIQRCVGGGETAWIQLASGDEEPEHPAPTITLTAADVAHGHGSDAATSPEPEGASTADGSGKGIAIAALIVGVVALVLGALALARTRRTIG